MALEVAEGSQQGIPRAKHGRDWALASPWVRPSQGTSGEISQAAGGCGESAPRRCQ